MVSSSFLLLVRIGAMGHIGRFRAPLAYPRGESLVCRTSRGLELGEVMGPIDCGTPDGEVIRRMTQQDHLLAARLKRNADEAFAACQELLNQIDEAPVLFDVELLFDGQGLYFYFLGEAPPAVDRLTQTLAETYDAHAQIARFSETLQQGCGPDCGTEQGGGCGTDGCSSCSIAAACRTVE